MALVTEENSLDMDKKKLTKTVSILIATIVGAGIGFFGATMGMDAAKTVPASQIIVLALLFIPAFFLVVAIHEAGHAVAGSIVNFDFRMYVVGPFMWDKEESGWKFKWNKNLNLSGGLVICLPITTEKLARRFSIYALGGPAASLAFAAFAYGSTSLIGIINSNDHFVLNLVGSLFSLVGFLSVVIFIGTILPMHTGGFYTDGARALRFLRGGDTSRFETLLMKLITSSTGGIRPRLLDRTEIQEALVLARKLNSLMEVYVYYFFYQSSFDEGNFDEAEKYLKEYLAHMENIPKGMRGSVFSDAAFFYAFARKDLSQAEFYWKQYVPSAIIPKAQVFATEAVILKLQKDEAASMMKIDMALKEIPNMMDRGVGIALREKLMVIKIGT